MKPLVMPLLISLPDACKLYGASRQTFEKWMRQALIPAPVIIGSRTMFRIEELRQHIAAGCPPLTTRRERNKTEGAQDAT